MNFIEGLSDDTAPSFEPSVESIRALSLQTQAVLTNARTDELEDTVQNCLRILKDFQRICAEISTVQ